jgi:OmcA/MtrC family decaheme c-type cytochrome
MTESCAGCHGAASLEAKHALPGQIGVQVTPDPTNPVSVAGSDILVTFNVKVNGVNRIDFVNKASVLRNHNEDAWWYYDAAQGAGVRAKIPPANWTLAPKGNGNYTATLTGLAATPEAVLPGTAFMLSVMGADDVTATAVVRVPGALPHDVVSDQACINCHGNITRQGLVHDVTNPQGVGPCIVCHNRVGTADPSLAGTTTAAAQQLWARGSGLMGIVHGIHNSAHMADGTYTFTWASNGNQFDFSKGFPSYMLNCSVCHDGAARLDAVKDAPVSFVLCMSCHDGWDGFTKTKAGASGDFHRTITAVSEMETPTCNNAGCHAGATGPRANRISAYHDGHTTERAGLIWGGADQSVVLGKRVTMQITGVAFEPAGSTTLAITWTAQLDGVDVDPCNTTVGSAAPLFHRATASARTGQAASNFTILRAYAQANDWVNGIAGVSSPGQPGSAASITASNTSCTGNVAKTRVPAETTTASRAVVAIQGKPQLTFDPTVGTSQEVITVRAVSPTREFDPATGAVPAVQRREIVSMEKCNLCHVGSMYQHGGNRVDSMELCVMCHNPASSEQQNRVNMGVTADEAYDGRAGQTYDMRYMVHAIHSAGETDAPLVYYRGNGIYAFGSEAAIAALPNWKIGTPATCNNAVPDSHGATAVEMWEVYGSDATGTKPTPGNGGICVTPAPASTAGTWRTFNEIVVHYPRQLGDCSACHVDGWEPAVPSPLEAVAVTDNAGAAPWANQLDDLLMGPAAASCMSCHQSGNPWTQYGLREGHAYDNGWTPAAFPQGRQTLIDAVK